MGEASLFYVGNVVCNFTVTSMRHGESKIVVLAVMIHEVCLAVSPTVPCKFAVDSVVIRYIWSAFIFVPRHLYQFINMRLGIKLGFILCISHYMRSTIFAIISISERSFLRRIVRKLNDLTVGCSEKYVIALADFLVDVLCQLLAPFSWVVSEEHLTVRLDIAHTRVADLAYAALALPALRSVIGGGRSVIGGGRSVIGSGRSVIGSGRSVISLGLCVVAHVLRGAGKGVVPYLLKLFGVLHHGLCLCAPCLYSLKRPAQLGRKLSKPFPDLCKQTGVFFCHHLRHLRVLKHHLAAVGYDLLGCVLHGYQAALPGYLLLCQRLNVCPALYEVLHHEVLKLSVCFGAVLYAAGLPCL